MVFRLAKLYEATGRPDDAMKMYDRFLELWNGATRICRPLSRHGKRLADRGADRQKHSRTVVPGGISQH